MSSCNVTLMSEHGLNFQTGRSIHPCSLSKGWRLVSPALPGKLAMKDESTEGSSRASPMPVELWSSVSLTIPTLLTLPATLPTQVEELFSTSRTRI